MAPLKRESLESCPEVPKRPDAPQDDNGGYLRGADINAIVPWRIAAMEQESGLHGDVRMTISEYGAQ